MQTDAYSQWSIRIVTFTVSALVVASAVYWGLKAWKPEKTLPVAAAMVSQPAALSPQAIARALGGGVAPPPVAVQTAPATNRYALVGVVAGRFRAGGAALIAVDGQDAKPVRVGNMVDQTVMLESVTGRRAVLASTSGAQEKFTLELPPLPK